MGKIRDALGPRAEIIATFEKGKQAPAAGDFETALLTAVGRRPMTVEDLALSLGRHRDEVFKALSSLRSRGGVRKTVHGGKTYFARARG
jgi:biotin operon repressor